MADVVRIKIKKLFEDTIVPYRGTRGAAGFDLAAYDDVVLKAGQPTLVKCGFSIEIPDGYEAQVRPRSGLALKHGIMVTNSPGTIDSDYRGEVGVILVSPKNHTFYKGDRIAQMVIQAVPNVFLEIVNELSTTTERGEHGYGSTG